MRLTAKIYDIKRMAGLFVGVIVVALLLAAFYGVTLASNQEKAADLIRLPVKTMAVQAEDGYFSTRSFTGRAVAGQTSLLGFEVAGTLNAVMVDIGDHVSAGQALAKLDPSRLMAQRAQAAAGLEEAQARLTLAEKTLNRVRETYAAGHASAQTLDESESRFIALKAQTASLEAQINALDVDLSKQVLTAPYDAVVTQRFEDEGTIMGQGKPLLELTGNNAMEAHIGMPPEYALKAHDKEQFRMFNGEQEMATGVKVKGIVPVIEGSTRTMLVTFSLDHTQVSRGALISAVVEDWKQDQGFWLPIRALSADVRGLWRVYKVRNVDSDPTIAIENVQILYSRADKAFVTGTLKDGDVIVMMGTDRLAPGQKVTVIAEGAKTLTSAQP